MEVYLMYLFIFGVGRELGKERERMSQSSHFKVQTLGCLYEHLKNANIALT